jgi:hypothetical protein
MQPAVGVMRSPRLNLRPGVVPGRVPGRPAHVQQCLTAGAGCMAAPALARGPQRGWSGYGRRQ